MPRKNPIVAMGEKARAKFHGDKRGGNGHKMKTEFLSAPIAAQARTTIGEANISSTKGGLRVKHTELVATQQGTVTYAATVYEINPGLSRTFPWLSGIAKNFESYKIHALRFRYVPRCSTTTVGAMMMSADYNSGDPTAATGPATETAMMITPGAIEGPPWATLEFRLNPARFNYQKFFTRVGGLANVELYDPAFVYVGHVAFDNNAVVGRLFVEYDIEFMTPQVPGIEDLRATNVVAGSLTASQVVAVPDSANLVWTMYQNPLGITFDGSGGFSFAPGAYLITMIVRADVTSTILGGLSRVNIQLDGNDIAAAENSRWLYVERNTTFIGSGSATVYNVIEMRGVLTVELATSVFTFLYTAVSPTATSHTVQRGGSTLTIEHA